MEDHCEAAKVEVLACPLLMKSHLGKQECNCLDTKIRCPGVSEDLQSNYTRVFLETAVPSGCSNVLLHKVVSISM